MLGIDPECNDQNNSVEVIAVQWLTRLTVLYNNMQNILWLCDLTWIYFRVAVLS